MYGTNDGQRGWGGGELSAPAPAVAAVTLPGQQLQFNHAPEIAAQINAIRALAFTGPSATGNHASRARGDMGAAVTQTVATVQPMIDIPRLQMIKCAIVDNEREKRDNMIVKTLIPIGGYYLPAYYLPTT